MTARQLADVIHAAQRKVEAAWDAKTGSYKLTTDEATQQAVADAGLEQVLWYPISLAFHWYNDLADWADHVVAGMTNTDEMLT